VTFLVFVYVLNICNVLGDGGGCGLDDDDDDKPFY